MPAPYGPPQQPSQQPSPPGQSVAPGQSADGPDLKFLLPLVAAGAGLVGYILGFFDGPAGAQLLNLPGFSLVAAAALAGLRMLPKAPNTLYAAVVLAAYATLGLLQGIVQGASSALVIVLLLLALVQFGAVLGVLLLEAGMISSPQKRAPQSGPLPQQGRPGPLPPQQPQSGPAEPVWNRQSGPVPPTGWRPDGFGSQPQPAPAPPGQQPGAWNPQAGGFAPGQPQSQPQSQPQGQQGQDQQQGQAGGSKGTQKMQYPGNSA